MKNVTVQEVKRMAFEIRDRCRLIAKNRGQNPRFWKSVFEEIGLKSGLKVTTIRRLLYSTEPKVRYSTAEKMEKILQTLGGPSVKLSEASNAPAKTEPATRPVEAKKGDHRVDRELIEGVLVKELRIFPDARGYLMEILRADDFGFFGDDAPFGQAYVTCVYPGVVKAWHAHRAQTDRFSCICGTARLVLYDGRPGSPTHGSVNQFVIGNLCPRLVLIPAGVQHGFAALGPEPALVLNIPTKTYDYMDPDEQRLDPHSNDIPFDWNRVDG
ncbi:MAG TPA: dTDP-4-dehydrorhamnose 3,5-epimerase family protein [bacterium]|nr:dTDP-4-dehydrorhamnose 3,5-epimerase family protein [bacterium]